MFNFITKLQNKVLYNYAIMSIKFNTYHEYEHEIKNLVNHKTVKVLSLNQFVTTEKRNPNDGLQISYWRKPKKEFEIQLETIEFNCFENASAITDNSEKIDFYFPNVLADEYPGLLERLGPPENVYKGVLGTSGRSIWVFRDNKPSLCLKIDTMQLNNRLFFNERSLYEPSVWHAQKIGKLLQSEKNIFFENTGGSAYFKNLSYEGVNKRYTYLLRHLNFSQSEVGVFDFLIPMQTLGSASFWKNDALLKTVGIKTGAKEFFEGDIARCLADMIKNSIDKTSLHLEAHMQNMTLHVRKGRAVKFIYHDLQDTLFDPVMYLCNCLTSLNPVNLDCFPQVFEEIYNTIDGIQCTRTVNSQGERIINSENGSESNNVVSFWRKYIRNVGDYSKIYNFLAEDDYFMGCEFEKSVLRHLKFCLSDLELDTSFQDPFLQSQLFWCLDRYYNRQQTLKLESVIERYLSRIAFKSQIEFEHFFSAISNWQYVASLDFPTRPDNVRADLISDIYNLFDEKIFLFLYDSKPVILIKTSMPTWSFHFS